MTLVVTLSGSPSAKSRSAGLLRIATRVLAGNGITVRAYALRDFPPQALIGADHHDPQVRRLNEDLARADGLLLATPIYKAAYSGGTKLLLDLLARRALERAVVLPLATGGSPAHTLAIDYAVRPVLAALGARQVVAGVYATDQDLTWTEAGLDLSAEVERRLSRALSQFAAGLGVPESRELDLSALVAAPNPAAAGPVGIAVTSEVLHAVA